MQGTRSLVVIAGGIVAIVVVAVVVVLLAGNRSPQQFPAGSPEATLQAYLATWEEGDWEAAYAFFSADIRDRYPFDQFRQAADDYRLYQSPEGTARQAYIDRVTGSDDRVTVHLTIEEFSGQGLGASSFTSSREIRLVREGGSGWKIDDPLVWLDPSPYGPLTP